MQNWNRFPRALLVLSLLIVLCAGLFAPRVEVVEARPLGAVDKLDIVISEFRFVGPEGANDEFIELYNPTNELKNLNTLKIMGSNASGTTSLRATLGNIDLQPGQYYLLVNSSASASLLTLADLTYPTNFTEDGGLALTLTDQTTIIDAVGLSTGSAYKEGTPLSSLSGSANQSYERKTGGNAGNCKDTDNNAADFTWNQTTSNPQNRLSPPLACIVVTNVTSTTSDGVYTDTSGTTVNIQVTFSTSVNVTGFPTLLMETGTTDRTATYASGSGSNTLTFNYTMVAGDSSTDLDYASANALSLSGGSIVGAVGDATLILPKPGQIGSLSTNKEIKIDVAGTPSVISFSRQEPTTSPTNANELTFRATFSEAVSGVDASDFVATGTTGTPTTVTLISSNAYDIKISGGNLALFNGDVGLNLSGVQNIQDAANTVLPTTEPAIDQTYTVDNTPPTATINQAVAQVDPASSTPVNFTIIFLEAIDVNSFSTSDITQNGSALGIIWSIVDSGDHTTFTLSATASGNGTIVPSIVANHIADLAGNYNTMVSTSTDNSVTLTDNVSPIVTINQAPAQADPTSSLPINFTVLFSEPINPSVFTTSDITHSGTATGVAWTIANSGDNMTFTLSATGVTGFGTIIPSMAANRVTDFSGNNNTASTFTDNSVTYQINSATARSVIINEVAWAGTTTSLTDDEWIELYNPGSNTINITGWTLKAADSTPSITLNGTIPAGGYFLLERDNDSTVSDILADQVYTGDLSNSGEALTLRDGANNVIDTANGNGGGWSKGSSSTYGTMERTSTTTESDSTWQTNTGIKRNGKNANNGDILGTPKSSNTPLPTPTPTLEKTHTPTPVPTFRPPDPRPIINEILPRPGFDWNKDGKVDVFDEFIEIKNLTSIDISLNGWKLDDEANLGSNPFTLPDVTLKPGQRIVFYALETNILLSDGGDTARLLDPNGKIYDAYTYSIAKAEDQSICRLPDGNVYNGWFEDCIPTPNLTNSREGAVPVMPDEGYQSPVCQLPDTLPADFLFAECRGYGANIWNADYWNQPHTSASRYIPQNTSKWEAIIE